MREKKKKPESLGFLENWNKEPKQHETDVALQLDPFSSFGVRNPRLDSLCQRANKIKRTETENRDSENTGQKGKEMMKSPLQEKKKKKNQEESKKKMHRPPPPLLLLPLQHMWSVLAPCRETLEEEENQASRGIIIKCREK